MNSLFHSLTVGEVLRELSSNMDGLSNKEARIRLEKFGFNEIPKERQKHPFLVFLTQFNSVLIYVLLVAAVISFFFGELIDVYVIIGVILINATIGFFQEYRAEQSIQALKNMIELYAKVYREEELFQVFAKELVPGDVILLEEGDRVPADARLLEIKNFRTVEASLTGESLPVVKNVEVLPEKISLADRKNMVFMGTFVAGGQAKAVVTATGIKTAIGRVAQEIEKIERGRGHFEKKVDKLAKQMGAIAFFGAFLTFFIGFFIREVEFEEIFIFAIASLVSAIPEGLPVVLVIVLAIGGHRMAKRNAIVRTLPAIETLGVVTVIATDKTGTLTQNTLNVEKIILPAEDEITVSGSGWIPFGIFCRRDGVISSLEDRRLSKLLHIAAVCNNARIFKKEEDYGIIGDPTEAALVVLAEKAGLTKEVVREKEKRIDDLPFNPELKYRASLLVVLEEEDLIFNPDLKYRASLAVLLEESKKREVYVIGAPEVVLHHSKYILKNGMREEISQYERRNILAQIGYLTEKGLRVLALAYREVPDSVNYLSEDFVIDLVFVGIVGMRDPPRLEVEGAVAKAKKAGIRVVMTTGDHKGTAVAIAREIGLIDEKTERKYPEVLTEQELLELSEEKFEEMVRNVSVFARLTPSMKLRVVETLQKQGHVVAVTGDGVNDAPALKKADIGISMGIIGTDVARESSEIVLADDNFASIVNAIEQGRIVFINTRQAASFLITTNFAEDVTIVSSLLLGLGLPLLPTQILWLNLVTDGVSDVALATEPGHGDVLKELPRKKEEDILSKEIVSFLLLMVLIMVIVTLAVFNAYLSQGIEKARTGAFVVMAFTQLFNVLNMRSLKRSVFSIGLFSNRYVVTSLLTSIILLFMIIYIPFFQEVFRFKSLSLIELLTIVLLSSLVFWFGELYKFLNK